MSRIGTFINSIKPTVEGLLVLLVLAVADALYNLATSGQQVTVSLVITVVAGAAINTLTSYYRAQRAVLPSLTTIEGQVVAETTKVIAATVVAEATPAPAGPVTPAS